MLNLKGNPQNLTTSNKLDIWLILIPGVLTLSITIAIFTILQLLPTKLPLFYSLPWGNGQLATKQQFLVIPAITAAIVVLNSVISWQLHPSQSFFKKILIFSPLLISLLLTVTFVKIILNFL